MVLKRSHFATTLLKTTKSLNYLKRIIKECELYLNQYLKSIFLMQICGLKICNCLTIILGHLKWYIKQNKSNVNMKQCVVKIRDCASICDMSMTQMTGILFYSHFAPSCCSFMSFLYDFSGCKFLAC